MSLDLKEKAQRRMRWVVGVLVGVVVLLLCVVAGLALGGSDDSSPKGDGGSSDKDVDENTSESTDQPSPSVTQDDGTYTDPRSWIELPDGAGQKNGLPVKFPRTQQGAAAAAVAMNGQTWTWDREKLKTAITTYMVDSFRDEALTTVDESVRAARSHAGIPETGKVPAGAELKGWPIGVQWEKKNAERVRVFVLVRVTSVSGPDTETRTQLQSIPGDVVWEKGDWRISPHEESAPDSPDPAEIGSKEFSDNGWKALQTGGNS